MGGSDGDIGSRKSGAGIGNRQFQRTIRDGQLDRLAIAAGMPERIVQTLLNEAVYAYLQRLPDRRRIVAR